MLPKQGVEGSNPFSRSKRLYEAVEATLTGGFFAA